MNLRSLTVGLPLEHLSTTALTTQVQQLLEIAGVRLAGAGVTPRTRRFTLPPVGAEGEAEGALLSRLRWVDELAGSTGVRWFCLPIDLVSEGPRRERLTAALDAVGRFPRMFLNLMLADQRRVAVAAANDAAALVLNVARKTNNGFDNFRVGASFNCPPSAPFFPFSRHAGATLAFSFALETAQLASQVIQRCERPQDVGQVRDLVVDELVPHLRTLDALGHEIAGLTGAEYRGLDASLAPLPGEVSVAAMVEHMTGVPIGGHASVFATAYLTDALRTALEVSGARPAGFNGVMYSVLEDERLAAASSQRRLTLDGLLTLATVCACGVDMLPVPGVAFPEEIAALMLDVAALSCALDKPLGVRVLPIPNRRENEFTAFNLDFLCDSRVVGLSANHRTFGGGGQALGLRTPRDAFWKRTEPA